MRDISEHQESKEKQSTKSPEKPIGTYDDLRSSDSSKRMGTYDDMRGQSQERSINTYDDMRGGKEAGDKTDKANPSDKTAQDSPEILEQKRLDQAAEAIKSNERMKPENWKTLDLTEKKYALVENGRAMGKAYDSPEPPLNVKDMGDSNIQGGYRPGTDYDFAMNEKGMDPNTEKKLFGDDPRLAVETHGHEFRHSYQEEQSIRYDKGFKTDDPVKAKEWSENLKDYNEAPKGTLEEAADPEEWKEKWAAYENQPVERDAREFGEKLSEKVYGKIEERE